MNGNITQILAGYGLIAHFSGSPFVPIGEHIKLSVDWYGEADATNWTSAVVAYNPDTWEILDPDTELHVFKDASGNVVLNIGVNMTATPMTIAVVLWGHPDYLIGKEFPEDSGGWVQLAYQTITVLPGTGDPEYRSFRLESLTVALPEAVIAQVSVEHQGPGESGELFIETNGENNEVDWEFADDDSWHRYNKSIELDIRNLGEGTYDLEIKLQSIKGPDLFINLPDAFVIGEEPPATSFSGAITGIKPSTLVYGEELALYVTFGAFSDGDLGWFTKVTVEMDGQTGEEEAAQWGMDGSMDEQKVHVGVMPNKSVTGSVTLWAREGWLKDWVKLAGPKTHSITLSGGEPPPACEIDDDCPAGYVCKNGECVPEGAGGPCEIDADCPKGYICKNGKCVKEGEESKFPWVPVALITGGAIVAVAAATRKPKA